MLMANSMVSCACRIRCTPARMAELGGGGTVSRSILALSECGIKRLLHCVGMLPAYQPDAANGTRELNVARHRYMPMMSGYL